MRRTTLGIIALLLLLVGAITAVQGPGGASAWGFSGVCIKSGLVLGALWLALPQIQSIAGRFPRWLIGRFVGKNQNANPSKPGLPKEAAGIRPPPPRPRRRSNS